MLKITKANKCFNKRKKNKIQAVNNTSLEFGNTGLIAFLGPSGCGKTTFLNMIGGLDELDSGKIFIDKDCISSKFMSRVDRIRNLKIGYIFQDYKLIENLSVFENVSFVLKMQGIKNKKEISDKVEYVLGCVGMLRYKKRPVNMLSGGERQRVGIARALVKDPEVILADEPTGNLDSKNSLEIMRIIKSISEKRLVLLVTHEHNLAKFYASRIIEMQDGTVIKDYVNKDVDDLDYEMDNCFYLKDFKEQLKVNCDNVDIKLYRNNKEKIKLEIVTKNNNIYIKSNNKIEVVDDDSNIEFINDFYKKIDRNSNKYDFDFKKLEIIGKKKYASIVSIFAMIIMGFRKLIEYPILKKILLVGFFIAGMFIMYSVSSYMASISVKDRDFITMNKQYLRIENSGGKVEDFLKLENNDDIKYVIPGSSLVSIKIVNDDYFQTSKANLNLDVSLSDVEDIKDSDLLYGRLPENDREVLLDNLAFTQKSNNDSAYQMVGLFSSKDLLNKYISIDDRQYLVSGIVDFNSPCLYTKRSEFISFLSRSANDIANINDNNDISLSNSLKNYSEYKDFIELKKGRTPNSDYEVIVNITNEESMPLNKEIDYKVNGNKLKVVGYYYNKSMDSNIYTSSNTIKYFVITSKKFYTIMPSNKENLLNSDIGNIKNVYELDRKNYVNKRKNANRTTVIISFIMLIISFIEIFLMIRASFLSRIKEVGIYRAIGVKRIDICKMFVGEILAITSTASMLGILFMAYVLSVLSDIKYLESYIMINISTLLLTIVLVYFFNIFIGLLPVINTIRKRPSEILSRYDLD